MLSKLIGFFEEGMFAEIASPFRNKKHWLSINTDILRNSSLFFTYFRIDIINWCNNCNNETSMHFAPAKYLITQLQLYVVLNKVLTRSCLPFLIVDTNEFRLT